MSQIMSIVYFPEPSPNSVNFIYQSQLKSRCEPLHLYHLYVCLFRSLCNINHQLNKQHYHFLQGKKLQQHLYHQFLQYLHYLLTRMNQHHRLHQPKLAPPVELAVRSTSSSSQHHHRLSHQLPAVPEPFPIEPPPPPPAK
jgi:hypothetical protein